MNNSENTTATNAPLLTFEKLSLRNLLKNCVMKITFTKKDGTIREMMCTLKDDVLNETVKYEKKTERVKNEHPNVLPVYDVQNKGFRSINMDTITKIEHL